MEPRWGLDCGLPPDYGIISVAVATVAAVGVSSGKESRAGDSKPESLLMAMPSMAKGLWIMLQAMLLNFLCLLVVQWARQRGSVHQVQPTGRV